MARTKQKPLVGQALLDAIVAKHREEEEAAQRVESLRVEMDRLLAAVPDDPELTQVTVSKAIDVSKSRIGQRVARGAAL